MDLAQEQIKTQMTNEAYIEPNVLELRLDTNELIDKIKSFLMGGRIVYVKDEQGQPKPQFIKEGEPMANDLGVQSLTSWISMQLNPSTVQGNLKEEQYFKLLERTRKNLAKNLLINSPRYEIKREDRAFIIDGIMNMLELFVSRTIGNKERDSYSNNPAVRIGNYVPQQRKGIL